MNSSGHQQTSTVKTRFNPCVIEYLKPAKKRTTGKSLHGFIIGTYELVEEGSQLAKQYTDLSDRNNRLGTLEVLEVDDNNSRVVLVYECQFGGVFDLRLIPKHDHLKCSKETVEDEVVDYRVVVAHANGVVALYSLTQRDEPKVELLKSWNTETKMLTTVEVSLIRGHCTFHAGSDDGQLVRVNCTTITGDDAYDEGNVSRKKITDFGHPIWYIRVWSPSTNEDEETDHPLLLFVGSEDSKWRVFNEESNELLYTNTDAASGITSFEFLPSSSSGEIKVLVGSYDEYMRLYRFSHSNSNSKLSIDSASLLYRIHIEGGGIWRMRAYLSDSSQIKILTAAMYAGVCLLTFDVKKIENLPPLDEKCDDKSEACTSVFKLSVPSSEDQSTTKKLIYGLSSCDDLSTVTFASFYEKELYILKAQKDYATDSVDSSCQFD